MIRSMTGYGRAEKTIDGREITVEMRAVNNRYLDLNVKLPRVYGFAEDAVKSLIKANVNRGKLDLFITVNVTADTSLQISLNKPVLEGYLAALKSIAADYGAMIFPSPPCPACPTSSSWRSRRRTSRS